MSQDEAKKDKPLTKLKFSRPRKEFCDMHTRVERGFREDFRKAVEIVGYGTEAECQREKMREVIEEAERRIGHPLSKRREPSDEA
jgi:hypothetical protein